MRAYTKAACDALDAARTVRRTPCRLVDATVPYSFYDPLAKRLDDWGGHARRHRLRRAGHAAPRRAFRPGPGAGWRILDFTNASAACTLGPEQMRYLPKE